MSAALWSPLCFSASFARFDGVSATSLDAAIFFLGLKTPRTFQTRHQPPYSPSCRRTAAVDQERCDITASTQPIAFRVYFKLQHFVSNQTRTAHRVSLAGSSDASSALGNSYPAAGGVCILWLKLCWPLIKSVLCLSNLVN